MNISFCAITPVIAKDQASLDKLDNKLIIQAKNPDFTFVDVTSLYKDEFGYSEKVRSKRIPKNSQLLKASDEGKSIGLLVTGDDYKNYTEGTNKLSSDYALIKHINRAVVNAGNSSKTVIDALLNRINSGN